MKVAVVTFPGSNCDRDVIYAFRDRLGCEVLNAWHDDATLGAVDAVILPGGFSYGDYLRCGAMAAHARLMPAIKNFAERGGPLLGICNGFQILCETGLLPGALIRNRSLNFVCKEVAMKVEHDSAWSRKIVGETLRVPVAHGEGNYVADEATLDALEKEGRVIFRYLGESPNGASRNIAGIANQAGNVVALMPHPERASDPELGRNDGLAILQSVLP